MQRVLEVLDPLLFEASNFSFDQFRYMIIFMFRIQCPSFRLSVPILSDLIWKYPILLASAI